MVGNGVLKNQSELRGEDPCAWAGGPKTARPAGLRGAAVASPAWDGHTWVRVLFSELLLVLVDVGEVGLQSRSAQQSQAVVTACGTGEPAKDTEATLNPNRTSTEQNCRAKKTPFK